MTKQYLDLAKTILEEGTVKEDRTGVGTKSMFGYQMRFNLQEGFPLLTTKKVPFGLIKSELLWFLKGDTNIRYLLEHNNRIWDEWAFEKYVASDDYQGPDMTDFGLRAEEDAAFNEVYKEEMKNSKTSFSEMMSLPNNTVSLGMFTERNGVAGKRGKAILLTKSLMSLISLRTTRILVA